MEGRMLGTLPNIRDWFNKKSAHHERKGGAVVATAAVILLLIMTGLFLYLRNLLENELEKHAESELTMKAMVIRGMLNVTEQTIADYIWDVQQSIYHPDSTYGVLRRVTLAGPQILGSGLPFVPDFYPEKGRLFEPYVMERDDSVEHRQLASDQHDYTTMDFYTKAIERDGLFWADPYYGGDGTHKLITTCSLPIRNDRGEVVCVLGTDVMLDWINDTLDARHVYPSSYNLLLTEQGGVISQPSSDNPLSHDVPKVVALLNDTTLKTNFTSSGISEYIEFHDDSLDADGTVFFAFMKGYPHWKIAVVCYDDEVYGDLNRLGILMVSLILLTFAVLLFLINLFSRNERRLHNATMAQERIGSELRIAQHIQQEMLPKQGTALNDRNDLTILGMQIPAKEVGGDLYDYYIRDEKLFFCIGDVSGKGVPSALVMAVIHSMFRMASAHEHNPARIMQTINETSTQGNESNMFVTFFLGVLDLPTGRLRYCNAGHDHPVMMGKQCEMLSVKANLPLGIVGDYAYVCQETVMEPDSILFLYTDGLTEAKNMQRELFREERMMDILEQARQQGATMPDVLLNKMQTAVHDFVKEAEQSDDLTMLAIRYQPQPEQNILQETLTLTNDVKEVKRLGEFIQSVTHQLQLEDSLAHKIRLAVEEAVVNVIDYAYPKDETGEIHVKAEADTRHLHFIITDHGTAFDPTGTITADTSLSVEERPIGGLGILLVRQLMDTINYERIDGQNVLTLTKKIDN